MHKKIDTARLLLLSTAMTKKRPPRIPLIHYPTAPDFKTRAQILMGRGIFNRRSFNSFMKHVDSRDAAVEVGAHVGGWTLSLSKLFKRVISFEPQPTNRDFLRKNLETAHVSNTTIRPEAVANNLQQDFSISQTGTRHIPQAHTNTPVKFVRLDDVLKTEIPDGQQIGALKINAGGLGLEVLKSGTEIIKQHMPTILLRIDRNTAIYGDTDKIYEYMSALGYKEAQTIRNNHIFVPE